MYKLSYGREDRLKQVKPGHGIFRITSDTKKLFIDVMYERISVGSIEDDYNADEIQTLPRDQITPKIYISKDTGELFFYNFNEDKWGTIGTGSGGVRGARRDRVRSPLRDTARCRACRR